MLRFGGATGRTVLGIKVNDQRMAPLFGEGERFVAGCWQAEIRNGLVDHESLSKSYGTIVVRKAVVGQVACF